MSQLWPKYWSFGFSISPSNEYSGLISFRMDCWISLQSKGLSRVFSGTTVQKHQFFGARPSLWYSSHIHLGFRGGSNGSIPGLGKSPGEGNGNPFKYSSLENSVNRGAWQATIHAVAKGQALLSN